MKKEMNNKGFSLVELIIVIAIMVILVAVLAPQYLKYVEKSRISTDTQTTVEFINALQVVASDPDIELTAADPTKYYVQNGTTAGSKDITVSADLQELLIANAIMTSDSFDGTLSTSKYQSTAYSGKLIKLELVYNWVDDADHSKGKVWSVKYTGVDNSGAIKND